MSKEEMQVKSFKDLVRVLDNQKRASDFTHSLDLISRGINLSFLKMAADEKLSDEDQNLLREKINLLIADLGEVVGK